MILIGYFLNYLSCNDGLHEEFITLQLIQLLLIGDDIPAYEYYGDSEVAYQEFLKDIQKVLLELKYTLLLDNLILIPDQIIDKIMSDMFSTFTMYNNINTNNPLFINSDDFMEKIVKTQIPTIKNILKDDMEFTLNISDSTSDKIIFEFLEAAIEQYLQKTIKTILT